MDTAALIGTLAPLLSAAAIIAFVCGGLLLMLQFRKLAGMAVAVGIALGVGAAVLPGLISSLQPMSVLGLLAITSGIGGVIALVVGKWKVGLSLLWPAFSRWILWPMATPYLPQAPIWLIVIMVAPFSLFILIWILQKVMTPIYGADAASHVTGTYLVRALDGTGRFLGGLLTAPLRALGRLLARP